LLINTVFLGGFMKLGWIGTGVMGKNMCFHLLNAGHDIFIYNRTREKAEELIASGAVWKNSPEEVTKKADIVFTIVGYPKDVENVYFGEKGIFKGVHKNLILVDMTTTKPNLAIKINKKAIEMGIDSIDAPVSGGDVGARQGTLTIMAGGNQETFDKVLPLLKLLGTRISLQGKAGAGQHTKMANQIVIAGTMMGVSEALVYAKTAGIDPEKMVSAISHGAAGCWTLDNLAPRVIKGDLEPGFFIDHFVKDMDIALEEAEKKHIKLSSLELADKQYKKLQAEGYGKKGTQALTEIWKKEK